MYLPVPLDPDRYRVAFWHMTPKAAAQDIARGLQALESPLGEDELVQLEQRLSLLLRGLKGEARSLIHQMHRERSGRPWTKAYASFLSASQLLEARRSDDAMDDPLSLALRVRALATTADRLWHFLAEAPR
ncbi:hypothetical protein [Streptomyces aureoversilis]|uniref:Uncharacterized protein n=1 Tax=Streptomyces aureoversilis TaxID=67277 RepID=A0ABV9ZT25_9ACTN